MPKIGISVDFETTPGNEAAFERLIREHAAATVETEPGCLRFEVLRVCGEDDKPVLGRFMVTELYADLAAVNAHRGTPRMATVRDALAPLIAKRRLVLGEVVD
ncbi:MAG TPA: putative quinol monooxygenase [Stellaceae bacterium]|nr:putative quinol monooxygenase [Stellaceae bacterium]